MKSNMKISINGKHYDLIENKNNSSSGCSLPFFVWLIIIAIIAIIFLIAWISGNVTRSNLTKNAENFEITFTEKVTVKEYNRTKIIFKGIVKNNGKYNAEKLRGNFEVYGEGLQILISDETDLNYDMQKNSSVEFELYCYADESKEGKILYETVFEELHTKFEITAIEYENNKFDIHNQFVYIDKSKK